MAIHPDYRGRGLSKILIATILTNHVAPICAVSVNQSYPLFQSVGFENIACDPSILSSYADGARFIRRN